MTDEERARMRLKIYLAHSIDHMEDHLQDLGAQAPFVAEPRLEQALGRAIADVETARQSLATALDLVGGAPAQQHAHDHGQEHEHEHGHGHGHGHAHPHP